MEDEIRGMCKKMRFKGEIEIEDCNKGKGSLKIVSGEKGRCKRIKVKCNELR